MFLITIKQTKLHKMKSTVSFYQFWLIIEIVRILSLSNKSKKIKKKSLNSCFLNYFTNFEIRTYVHLLIYLYVLAFCSYFALIKIV